MMRGRDESAKIDRNDVSKNFFFQDKDGIRGAQESRGLENVYKRQLQNKKNENQYFQHNQGDTPPPLGLQGGIEIFVFPVPFNHRTLPTKGKL